MKKIIPLAILLETLIISAVIAQTTETTLIPRYVPQDSTKIIWSIGAGIGVPYGVFGGKYSLGMDMISCDVGLGIVPISWTPALSVSGVIHFRDRYATIRPKFTFTFSNVVVATIIYDETYISLYDKTYAGIGVYGGLDYRTSKTSPFFLDLNIGWIFPFVDIDEVRRSYDKSKTDLIEQGYTIDKETISFDSPKISIGITYSPRRSYKLIYDR